MRNVGAVKHGTHRLNPEGRMETSPSALRLLRVREKARLRQGARLVRQKSGSRHSKTDASRRLAMQFMQMAT